ncbi:SDR family NAD(P)-dependent oxidoreductase [Kineococcus sp. SYSU DK006]|uniref:SDR family NAD(P)-dependent oxidoreductase n=1 Tax=Kineococcus sp. SYSU DK006 TaxID=3383127 RepID=UPI003D7CEE95
MPEPIDPSPSPVHAPARTALVTGGGSGIGAAVVAALAATGTHVAVLDRDTGAVPAVAGVSSHTVDLRDEAATIAAVRAAVPDGSRLDVLVNAAGIEHVASLEQTSAEDWDRVLHTNLRATFLVLRETLPALRRARGCVINVASQLALVGAERFAAYTASKAAVLGFTRSTALELAGDGVRVNAVCPGAVDTPLLRRQFADGRRGPQGTLDDLVAMHPLGRLATAQEIAEPIVFLAGPGAAFMTGSTLVVDGGYTA